MLAGVTTGLCRPDTEMQQLGHGRRCICMWRGGNLWDGVLQRLAAEFDGDGSLPEETRITLDGNSGKKASSRDVPRDV